MPKDEKNADFLEIHEEDLLGDLDAQPKLMLWACEREADARHEHAQVKAALDVCEAELKLDIRRHPGNYGIEPKPTEATVNALVTLHHSYQDLVAKLNDAKHKLDVFGGRVAAVTDKRRVLERRVELLSIHYWGSDVRPKTPVAREATDDMRKDSARRPVGRG